MTTATLATGNRTMTEVRPRRSLEELVDRLMAALVLGAAGDGTGDGAAERGQERPRGAAAQAGG